MILHSGQREVFEHPAQCRVVAAGRGWGKDTLIKAEIARAKRADLLTAYVCPFNRGRFAPRASTRLHLYHGLETDSQRGILYDLLIINEAALLPCLAIYNQFTASLKATRRVLIIGTPAPYDNPHNKEFQFLHERGAMRQFSRWASWRFSSTDNPHLGQADWIGLLPDGAGRSELDGYFPKAALK